MGDFNNNKRATLRRIATADTAPGSHLTRSSSQSSARRLSCRGGVGMADGCELVTKQQIFKRVRKQSMTVADYVNDSSRRVSVDNGKLASLPELQLHSSARSEPIKIKSDPIRISFESLACRSPTRSPKEVSLLSSSPEMGDRLNYQEMLPRPAEEIRHTWRSLLEHPKKEIAIFDLDYLIQAVQNGVSRSLRSKVWLFLSEQCLRRNIQNGINYPAIPRYDYKSLLEQPCPFDQTILADINRTFPDHPYFREQFGAGQINLFNVLKAYAILDPEVGYCQGLSFVASTLLLHADEQEVFHLLCKLMFNFGLRNQYLPDMLTLQVQMYQLSRALNIHYPDLYEHFENHDIPSIFSAPWFLTLFASTFPTGFAVRVIDMVFLLGRIDIVFPISLVLLGGHTELIKHSLDFDGIMSFLRCDLPGMSIIQMEKIFGEIFEIDIERELLGYAVEYEILQAEEAMSPGASPGGEDEHVSRLKAVNRNLRHHNKDLLQKLKSTQEDLAESRDNEKKMEERLKSAEADSDSLKTQIGSLTKRVNTYEFEHKALLNAFRSMNTNRSASPDGTNSSDSGFHDRP